MPEIIQDSIISLVDSIVINQTELIKPDIRFEGELLQLLPHQNNWISIVILTLFIIFIISFVRSHNWIIDFAKNFLRFKAQKSTLIKKTIEAQQSQLLMIVFATCSLSLFVYLLLYEDSGLNLSTYLILISANFVFLFVKFLVSKLVAFTFVSKDEFNITFDQYLNIIFIFSLIIYPIIILKSYFQVWNNPIPLDIFAFVSIILVLLFITIHFFQFFFDKILDFFHIMLYLCTLEILPFLGIFLVNKWIITSL